jgi:thiol-disulfide isomerase/thioredoxin
MWQTPKVPSAVDSSVVRGPRRTSRSCRSRGASIAAAIFVQLLGCGGATASRIGTPEPPVGAAPLGSVQQVTWHEDRIEAATAAARERGALLVVDAWAPWCHTCLSMKREVLASPELGAYGDAIVFAAVDTDKPSSAAFVGRYAVEVWPTFFVIDPASDRVLAVHGGAASLEELRQVLDGALALKRSGGGGSFESALAEGAAAYAARKFADATAAYLRAGANAHPRASEAHLGAIRAAYEAEDFATCADVATKRLDAVTGSAMAADFTFYARQCAKKLPAGDARASLEARTVEKLRRLTEDPPASASIDDRADALAMLAEAEGEGGNAEAARAATAKRVALLDAAAAGARTPEEAAVHDYMRMRAYEDAGTPERAVAMLEERTKQTPSNYEPFARLASVLAKTDPKRAVAVWDQAIALSYGPRRVRYLEQKAELHVKLADMPGVIATRKSIVAALEALPPGQADAARLGAAKKALAAAEAEEREQLAPGPSAKGARPTGAR